MLEIVAAFLANKVDAFVLTCVTWTDEADRPPCSGPGKCHSTCLGDYVVVVIRVSITVRILTYNRPVMFRIWAEVWNHTRPHTFTSQ